MNKEVQPQQINALKEQFEALDHPVEDVGVGVIQGVDLSALRLAIALNAMNTFEVSLDQISICFDVSKVMFFYADEIVKNPKFWDEENWVNRYLASNNFKMAKSDMEFVETVLNQQIGYIQSTPNPKQSEVLSTLNVADRYHHLVGRFHEATGTLTELDGRRELCQPLYDEDQKPDMQLSDAEASLKNLNLLSSQNAEYAISRNIDTATICLKAARDFRASVGMFPEIENHVALVLQRFEILQDAHDNRYGFTQLRFER